MQAIRADLQAAHFVVKNRFGKDIEMHAMGSNLSLCGLDLDTPGEMVAGERFVWLEFTPGDAVEPVKALGEITDRTNSGVRIQFKHLFPDQRRKLAIMLDEGTIH